MPNYFDYVVCVLNDLLFGNCGLLWHFVNPLNAELNPICHLLALLRAHHILHVSRVRIKFLFPCWKVSISVNILSWISVLRLCGEYSCIIILHISLCYSFTYVSSLWCCRSWDLRRWSHCLFSGYFLEECSLRLFRGCDELVGLKLGFWYACGYSSGFVHFFTDVVDSEFFPFIYISISRRYTLGPRCFRHFHSCALLPESGGFIWFHYAWRIVSSIFIVSNVLPVSPIHIACGTKNKKKQFNLLIMDKNYKGKNTQKFN